MSERRILGIVAVIATLTGALYFWHFDNNIFPDSAGYIGPAHHLLDGNGFTNGSGLPETERTPGYPLFLAAFFAAGLGFKAALVVQHVLRIVIILSTTWFVLRTFGRGAALATGILMAIDFTLLESANSVLSDATFAVLMTGAYWLLWRERAVSSAGLVGVAIMIRPIGVAFVFPAALFVLFTRKTERLKTAVLFIVVCAVLPTLWAARNWRATGNFTFSTAPAADALIARMPGAIAMDMPGDFRSNVDQASALACQEMLRRYSQPCSDETLTYHPDYYSKTAFAIAREHPGGMIKSTVRGFAVMMLDGGPNTLTGLVGTTWAQGMRILLVYTVPLLILSIIGFGKIWHTNRSLFFLSLIIIGCYVLVSAGTGAYGRYRVPFLCVYLMSAGLGICSLVNRRKRSAVAVATT